MLPSWNTSYPLTSVTNEETENENGKWCEWLKACRRAVAARQNGGGLICVPSCPNLSTASTRQAMYGITLRCVRATIVAVEKQ